ncbi:RNA methyltransferase [Desulfoluna butyratoxydans]|uniref:tRNA (cytidine/uridine-2'-O-)-methyltransferase TrmJ n=1 Tax=Desulfoluna butyratoxydans TaxID=231438 RepID=A0A4U8YMF2_9BACT|nr:RNA methyltransferase [Desulfoluna butyratoxydans]VFQ45225.1 rna methyltransferase trmh group 1 [Desulfoluna butyratoxydans]
MSNAPIPTQDIAIVLVRPRYPENIGSAARAMMNMGFSELILVNPLEPDQERMRKTATHHAAGIIDTLTVHDNLDDALKPFTFVAATTTRKGKKRQGLITPQSLVERVGALSPDDKVAILFGSEDKGLTNDELRLADALVSIPTMDFSSINLAQSVMILCYELSRRQPTGEKSALRLANKQEVGKVHEAIEELLMAIELHNPENPDHWPARFRNLLSRAGLRAGDTALVLDFIGKTLKKLRG